MQDIAAASRRCCPTLSSQRNLTLAGSCSGTTGERGKRRGVRGEGGEIEETEGWMEDGGWGKAMPGCIVP